MPLTSCKVASGALKYGRRRALKWARRQRSPGNLPDSYFHLVHVPTGAHLVTLSRRMAHKELPNLAVYAQFGRRRAEGVP